MNCPACDNYSNEVVDEFISKKRCISPECRVDTFYSGEASG